MAGEGAGAGRTVAETVDADRIVRRPAAVSGETAGGFPGAARALAGAFELTGGSIRSAAVTAAAR